MIKYHKKIIDSIFDRGGSHVIEGVRFEDCIFVNSAISLTEKIDRRSTVRNAKIIRCKSNGCHVGPVVLEDVTIDGLLTNDLLIIWGATFHHVTLKGDIGKLKINRWVDGVDRTEATQGPFDADRQALYQRIDWALDISQARFKEFDVEGIPAKLIRRDPESQVVVTRERALQEGWREQLSPSNTLWPFVIDLFLSDGVDDVVLVAPLGAPKPKRDRLLQGLKELRDLGVANPD